MNCEENYLRMLRERFVDKFLSEGSCVTYGHVNHNNQRNGEISRKLRDEVTQGLRTAG